MSVETIHLLHQLPYLEGPVAAKRELLCVGNLCLGSEAKRPNSVKALIGWRVNIYCLCQQSAIEMHTEIGYV